MKLKLAAAVAAVSVATVPAAFADENAGWYLGGGVGSFNVGIDNPDQVNDAVGAWDEDDNAYKLFGGYRLNKFLAFKLDSSTSVSHRAPWCRDSMDLAVDGFAPFVVGTIPLGNWFEVYGRLGYYFYDANIGVEDEINGNVEFDEESEDLVYGAGIGANIGERLNVRFEYERYDLEGTDDADALWLTAGWRF